MVKKSSPKPIKKAPKKDLKANKAKSPRKAKKAPAKDGGRYFKGALKEAVLKRDKYTCVICGRGRKDGIRIEADHIKEWDDGGRTILSNGQTLCGSCNKKKHYDLKKKETKQVAKQYNPIDIVDNPIFPKESIQNIIKYVKGGKQTTEFKKEYVEKILEMMAQGMGIQTVCMYLGISYNVMLGWRKKNKAIEELIKYGKQLEKQWWLETGRKNIYNKDFNHVLWMMNMSNRFKWVTNKGKIEGKVAHAHIHRHDGKIELEDKVRNANTVDRCESVIGFLAKSGAFIKPETIRGTTDTTDAETD